MHSNITKKCFLAFFNYIWMPIATTPVPCKQERIVSITCAEGRQLPYPSVCQYLCTFPSPLTPTLGSKRLCLAQAVPRALQECLWAGFCTWEATAGSLTFMVPFTRPLGAVSICTVLFARLTWPGLCQGSLPAAAVPVEQRGELGLCSALELPLRISNDSIF